MYAHDRMRALILIAALAGGACQSQRQAWIVTGIAGGVAGFGGYYVYDDRNNENEDEGTLIPLGLLVVGGVTAVFSLIDALTSYRTP